MANTVNKAKTHCPQGHPYVKENLVQSALKRGRRSCKICRNAGDKKRRNPKGNISPTVLNSQKTHCPEGHLLKGRNLIVSELKIGKRSCRICKNKKNKIREQKPERKKYKLKWNSKNLNKLRGYSAKWRRENPEKAKQWDKEHPEQVKTRQRKHEKNPKRITYRQNWQKLDYEINPEKTLQKNIRQLEKLGNTLELSSGEYKRAIQAWSKTVKKRNPECAICGTTKNLKSHHIFYKAKYPLMSLMEDNGIVLCKQHHYEAHGINLKIKTFYFY
jgi:hypothetical protein